LGVGGGGDESEQTKIYVGMYKLII
jgi:hypothetical protein